MGKKYVATIMDKHYLGDDSFIYSCNHIVVGEIDEETFILKDEYGNEYDSMLSSTVCESNIPYAYANILDLDEMSETFSDSNSYEECLREYEENCRGILHFVGKTDSGKTYFISLDKDNLKSLADDSEKEDEDDLPNEIKQIIMDVINGEYSLSELKDLKEALFYDLDAIESALDTVELQIEASENGQSYVELADEREELLKNAQESRENLSEPVYKTVWNDDEIIEEEEEKEKYIDISDLFNKVTATLIAQDEPARRVICEIARKEMDDRKKKEGILLTGATGVGKTELMRLIAKYLDKPFYKIDSTQLTTPGYTGLDIEEALWDLYVQCGKNKKLAESAIIFFDEIDKKGSPSKDDHSGQGVLNILLQFIEGTTYKACQSMKYSRDSVEIDTSGMTVILGGAYTDVYSNLASQIIGFNNSKEKVVNTVSTKDFVERGMMTEELMGRVMVVRLNDLDVEAIKRIMLESNESSIKIQQEIFDKLGVKLTFTDDYTTAVAEDAYKKKTGARGLNGIIDESTWQVFEEVYSNRGVYEEAILNEDSVRDSSCYQLVKKHNEVTS